MTDLDELARDLLAAEYGKAGSRRFAEDLRSGCDIGDSDTAYAVQAIRAALLAAPPGWKLVPVIPTEDMEWAPCDVPVGGNCYMCSKDDCSRDDARRVWAAMLAAAPEVK